jgi:NAD(P)-dependent dehydrogenase (short-subunit alcohol dehydrogenase family)
MMKKLLILGGNSDIGKAVAEKFSGLMEYDVHVHYNKNKPNDNPNVTFIQKDLSEITNDNWNQTFRDDYDAIVNLVGYISDQSFAEFNLQEIQKTLLVNSLIPMLIMSKSLEHMAKNNYGRIVNTSSVGVKFGGGSNTFAYSLSKHLNEFMPNKIKEKSADNVFYNTLRIGVTDTKFHGKIQNKSLKNRIKSIPTKTIASTDDIADYIKYLIVNNNFITGEVVNITGGE